MKKQGIVYLAIYIILLSLYGLSVRFFSYGLEITDVIAKEQAFNLSGLILIMAIAITFNIMLIKGVFEIKKLESTKNR